MDLTHWGLEFCVLSFVDLSALLLFLKSGGDASPLIKSTEENKELTVQKEAEVQAALAALQAKLGEIGNLVHDSVPVDNNEVRLRSSHSL